MPRTFLYVSSIRRPTLSGLRTCSDQRQEFHDPAIQRGMIDFKAPFGHDLLKIPTRKTVADIDKHSMKDHVLWEMVAFEINRHGWVLASKFKTPLLPNASQSNQPRKLCDRTVFRRGSRYLDSHVWPSPVFVADNTLPTQEPKPMR